MEAALRRFNVEDINEGVDRIKEKYEDLVLKYHHTIPSRLVYARIDLESGGNPNAVARPQKWQTGHGSEMGLLMLSPDTRAQYNISKEEAVDPETNIRIGCKIWNAWVGRFFIETLGDPPLPVLDDVRGTWAWMVTAVGPGATRRLRSLNKNSYDLENLILLCSSEKVMTKNAKYWGSQDRRTVTWRVGTAIAIARICAQRMPFDVEEEQ